MLCECGCGAITPIVTSTHKARGMIRGEHRRFCNGHQWRVRGDGPDYYARIAKAQTGVPRPSLRGRKQSPEHVARRADIQRGRTIPNHSGDKHWNWKGGASAGKGRINAEYFAWMKGVKRRDNYTCQSCGYRAFRGMHAHHKLSYAEHPETRYAVANGVTYCGDCHRGLHAATSAPSQ